MSFIKTSELESVTELSESDTLLIIQNDEPRKVTLNKFGEIIATKNYVDERIAEIREIMQQENEEGE